MKHIILPMVLLTVLFALTGCGSGPTAVPNEAAPSTEDQASFIAGLQSAGATVEVADSLIQEFFTPEGTIIKVNGQDLQVFEYETAEAMEDEASQVAPDGGSVGTSMMTWMDAPHFYKAGRIIVLYVGSDRDTLDLLERVIGPQFAGQ